VTISSLDEVIAGNLPPVDFRKIRLVNFEAASQLASLAYVGGWPGAAVAPSPGLAGVALTSYGGQLPFTNPAPGDATYLAYFEVDASSTCTMYLVDRLWHNSAIVVTTTTAQVINSVAWPPRDRNGSTNGNGVVVGIEVSTATTNAGAIANTTMSYTNSDGVAGRTATIPNFPATAASSTFVPFSLMTGDIGVQSIQSVTLGTSYASGAIHLVAYLTLSRQGVCVANTESAKDATTGSFPLLFDNTVPFLLVLPTAASAPLTFSGVVVYAQG